MISPVFDLLLTVRCMTKFDILTGIIVVIKLTSNWFQTWNDSTRLTLDSTFWDSRDLIWVTFSRLLNFLLTQLDSRLKMPMTQLDVRLKPFMTRLYVGSTFMTRLQVWSIQLLIILFFIICLHGKQNIVCTKVLWTYYWLLINWLLYIETLWEWNDFIFPQNYTQCFSVINRYINPYYWTVMHYGTEKRKFVNLKSIPQCFIQ